MSNWVSAFYENTVHRKVKGRYEIKCRLGLWSIGGPDHSIIKNEAMHYFMQYYNDGEYDEDHCLERFITTVKEIKNEY